MDKKFSIVIFGTGSIGRRHYEIAQNLENCNSYIFSKKVSRNLELETLGYQIFKFDKKCNLGIIATEANNHIKDIKKFLRYAEKWIIEKPIYSIYENHLQDAKDFIFDKNICIGYNKRFELGINEIFKFIKGKKIKNAHFKCFSNLEKWRDEPVLKSISLNFLFEKKESILHKGYLLLLMFLNHCGLIKCFFLHSLDPYHIKFL